MRESVVCVRAYKSPALGFLKGKVVSMNFTLQANKITHVHRWTDVYGYNPDISTNTEW